MPLLVSSGYGNKNTSLGGFLPVLKAEKSQVKVPADSDPGDSLLPYLQRDHRKRIIFCVSPYKGTSPIHEGSALATQPPPPNTNL